MKFLGEKRREELVSRELDYQQHPPKYQSTTTYLERDRCESNKMNMEIQHLYTAYAVCTTYDPLGRKEVIT